MSNDAHADAKYCELIGRMEVTLALADDALVRLHDEQARKHARESIARRLQEARELFQPHVPKGNK